MRVLQRGGYAKQVGVDETDAPTTWTALICITARKEDVNQDF